MTSGVPSVRKRARSAIQKPPSPPSSANASAQASSPSHPSTSFISADDDSNLPPFLNTSFSTLRLSPLHVGPQPLTHDRLHSLSQRLRDLLVGDIVRGVELGLDRAADDGAMRRAGALDAIGVGWVRLESLVGRYIVDREREDMPTSRNARSQNVAGELSHSPLSLNGTPGEEKALLISLQYENAECAALLLPNLSSSSRAVSRAEPVSTDKIVPTPNTFNRGHPLDDDSDFLHLPLLLLRMPAPLKTVIIDFLSRTFDCRISSLGLGTRSLVCALEQWIVDSRVLTNGQLTKDVVLTLAFHGPTVTLPQQQEKEAAQERTIKGNNEIDTSKTTESAMGIKSIDVIVPHADLLPWLRAGKKHEGHRYEAMNQANNDVAKQDPYDRLKRRKLGGNKDEEGWTWRRWSALTGRHEGTQLLQSEPFTEALALYIRKHLALDIFHPAVRIVKIACGGFVLSEGRIKLFGGDPSNHAQFATTQRALCGVLEGLLERAQWSPWNETLSRIVL